MAEVSPEEAVHSAGGLLRVAGHRLDVNLEIPLQEFVHLPIIVVVIPAWEGPAFLTLCFLPPPHRGRKQSGRKSRKGGKKQKFLPMLTHNGLKSAAPTDEGTWTREDMCPEWVSLACFKVTVPAP